MKRNSSMALFSLLMGILALCFAQTRAGLLLVLAVPLGVVAAYAGVLAVRLINQAPNSFRGKGPAITGVCFGVLSAALSFYVLVAVMPHRYHARRAHVSTPFNSVPPEPPIEVRRPDITRTPRPPSTRPFNSRNEWRPNFTLNTMPDGPVTNFTSNLPIVIIDTGGRSIYKEQDTLVRARFIQAENGRSTFNGKTNYDGLGTIQLRGFSTLRLPKRSYTFHTVDAKTNQTKVPLLGLPREEDWVLYAPYEDKTMLRDVLAYELSNQMGHYAPRTRFVELFLNSSGRPVSMRDYAGIYVLIEKIKRGKDRVDVAKLDTTDKIEPNVSGGYIIKRDHSEREESGFYTRRGGPYYYVYPKAADIIPEQKAWLVRYLNQFEAVLYSSQFADQQKGYPAFLDVDSFVDAHWLVEVSKNVDGFRYSAYLTKDRNGKLKMEPPWDWNRSFGNANYYGGYQVNNWYWTYLRPNEISWYRRLVQDADFQQRCADRWWKWRKEVLNPKRITARVDEMAAQLKEPAKRNFKRWPILGQQITCNYYVGSTYDDEVRWLKNWIERRIAWIDAQTPAAPRTRGSTVLVPGQEVLLEGGPGEIFYTLDGTDPRASGGAVAPGAKGYQGAIEVEATSRLFARSRHNGRWSAPLCLNCQAGAAAAP